MSSRILKLVSIAFCALFLICVEARGQAPTITAVSPTSGPVGALVTITGSGFGATQGTSTVSLGGTSATAMSWSDTSLSVAVPSGSSTGSFSVTVNGSPATSPTFTVTALPSGWTDADIGSVGAAGSATYANGLFTVKGSGNGVTGTSDSFHFTYQTMTGDGSIVARVVSSTTSFSQAGIIIRDTLATGAANAFVAYQYRASPPSLSLLYDRPSTNASTTVYSSSTGYTPPFWIKLVRSGSTFTSYTSFEGHDWVQFRSQTVTMGSSVSVGLAVSSQSAGSLATATFDNVSISSNSAPAPAITSLSATAGSVGSQVVISGSGFGTSQGSSVVLLNGAMLTVNSWSATSISVTVPSGATSGYLGVAVAPSLNASNAILFSVTSQPLPSGWLDDDVGVMDVQGSATYANGVFTIKGAGSGIGTGSVTTSDGFHFVYQPLSGDGTIVARVTSTTVSTSKVGVMIRETLDPSSTNEIVYFYNSGSPQSIILSERLSPGASTSYPSSLSATVPYWLKLARSSSVLTAYTSTDGMNWTQLGSYQWIGMQQNVYVGLAVTGNGAGLSTTTFDYVSVSSSAAPAPSITSLSATTGAVGSQVVINGSGFGATQGSSAVFLNGTAVTINSWSDTSVTFTIPTGATSGPLVVSVAPSMNDSNPMMFTVTSQSLLAGWDDRDVGPVGTKGSATFANNVFTVQGAGNSIGGTADSFHFVYQPLTTNGTITARVVSNGGSWGAQAGVMMRETMDANSAQASVLVGTFGSNNYASLNSRAILGGATNQSSSVTITQPYWIRLVRNANLFSGFISADGISWTQVGSTVSFPTAQQVFVGMVVSSGTPTVLSTATFDNVSVGLGSALPNPVITGLTPSSGPPGTFVTINGSGFGATQGTSTVSFNGAAVTTITSWSDTQVVVAVPDGASSGPVMVTVGGITGQGPTFTVVFTATLTDSLGNQTSYTAGMAGGQWSNTDAQGSGCSSCTTRGTIHNQYDGQGNLAMSTDAMGFMSRFHYDSSNNLASQIVPVTSTTTATTTYTYNSFGEVLTATDPLGFVTTNVYDSHGNLTSVTTPAPNGSTTASVTSFAYNTLGELTSITDPLNHVTTLTYNPVGLIATITDAQNHVTTYGYDSHGNRTSVTDALNHQTTFSYDAMDRLTTITYPDTTTTQFAYDSRGRRTSVTDQNGKVTTYAYDDADRLTSVTDAASNVTTYGYDTENNLTSIQDANLHTTYFAYDAFGRVTQTTFPSGFVETYGYDANNNLTSKTDRKNQQITYGYDQSNRLVSKTYPDSSTVNYSYDLDSRLTQVTDPTGTYSFTFDNMGRLTGTTTSYSFLTGRNFTTSYSYDKASNRTGFTDPESGSTTYAYDTLNRLQTLTPPSAFTATGNFGFSYDALSRRTQMTRPNSVTTNYAYDNLSRLTSVLHQLSGSTIDGATYTVDNAGNRTSKTDNRTSVTTNYSYDNIYQLTQATQGATTTESYTYDPVGNRLSDLATSGWSNNTSNELTSRPGVSYAFDNNGNTLTKADSTGTTNYTWDYENRLTSVTLPASGGTVSFKYDPFGRRIYKSSSLGTSVFAYDSDNLVEETNSSGTAVARYAQGLNIDEPLAMLRSSATSYLNSDGLGTITSLGNIAGSLAQTYTFDSFGNQTASSGSLTNPFQYTAREFDSETGVYFYRARYYGPQVGRFLNEDLLGPREEGPNLYAYVGNGVIGSADPLGLFKIDQSCKSRCMPLGGGGPNNPNQPPHPENLENLIQQGVDQACSNLQGIDPKYRSCIQKSCKNGTIKCKEPDSKNCKNAGGYNFRPPLFKTRTANICMINYPDWTTPSWLQSVYGDTAIHEWAHGCGWNGSARSGAGIPTPDRP